MQCLVIFVGLLLELTAQSLVELLQIVALLLQTSLDSLGLLTCVGILLHLLLEVGSGGLQLLLLAGERLLDVVALLLEDLAVLLAELILRHDGVYLHESNLGTCGFRCCLRSLVVHLRLALVAADERES